MNSIFISKDEAAARGMYRLRNGTMWFAVVHNGPAYIVGPYSTKAALMQDSKSAIVAVAEDDASNALDADGNPWVPNPDEWHLEAIKVVAAAEDSETLQDLVDYVDPTSTLYRLPGGWNLILLAGNLEIAEMAEQQWASRFTERYAEGLTA